MSMSISATDILKCIELCKWMLDRCFKRVHSAHVKYLQFGRDIESLLDTLDKLCDPFQRATGYLRDISHPSQSSQQQLEKESGELMGGLQETIRECQAILTKHVDYQYDETGPFANVKWGLKMEKRVEQLRSDIQFHNLKIQLLLKPIELTILTEIAFGVEEILTILRERLGLAGNQEIDPIPDCLADRFLRAIETNSPGGFTTLERFPLKEGFDCLYYHFWRSTVSSSHNEASGKTIEQYLSLLKARWILDVLKRAGPFRSARRGSLYPPSVLGLEKQIISEYGRIDTHQFRDADLMKLDKSAFLIWPEEPPVIPPSLAEPRLSEQEILRLQLPRATGAPREELIIFRRGPTVLRLARNIFPSNSNMPQQESEKIDTHSIALIPWYVIQSQPLIGSPLRLEMSSGRSGGGTLYDFQTDEDLFSFQTAVTGYKPVADLRDVKWTLHKKSRFCRSESLEGVARVQIWSYNRHNEVSSQTSEMGNAPYVRSTRSSSLEQASSDWSRSHPTLAALVDGARGLMVSSTDSAGNDALLALTNVPLPVVVVYTKLRGRHTMLHFQVSDKLKVDESKCDCKRAPVRCKDAVLRDPRSSTTIRSVSAADDELDSWNLSIFGSPTHPHFNDDDRVKKLDCRALHLRFPEVEDKDYFKSHLQIAKVLHEDAQQGNRVVIHRASRSSKGSSLPSPSQYSINSTSPRSASLVQQSTPLPEDDAEWLNTNTPTATLASSQQQTMSGNNTYAEPTLDGDTDGLHLDGYHKQHAQSENISPVQGYGPHSGSTRPGMPYSAFPSTADSHRRHSQPSMRKDFTCKTSRSRSVQA